MSGENGPDDTGRPKIAPLESRSPEMPTRTDLESPKPDTSQAGALDTATLVAGTPKITLVELSRLETALGRIARAAGKRHPDNADAARMQRPALPQPSLPSAKLADGPDAIAGRLDRLIGEIRALLGPQGF